MEKRIYAVVAETVWSPEKGVVPQIAGRMAAQACHAVSRMKMHRLLAQAARIAKRTKLTPDNALRHLAGLKQIADEATTTILLSCRDERELAHVKNLLAKKRITVHTFEDTNPEVYGDGVEVTTALATRPVTPDEVKGILDYLPLWTPKS